MFEHLFVSAHSASAGATAGHLAQTIAIGVVGGWGVASLLAQSLGRYWIPDFLYGAVFLTVAHGAFAVSNWLSPESALITVTLMGIVLANQKSRRSQRR